MADFLDQPILNSPYERPGEHWELEYGRWKFVELRDVHCMREEIDAVLDEAQRQS